MKHIGPTKTQVAQYLLPLYNQWHQECVKNFDHPQTAAYERLLWGAVHQHPWAKLPTTQTAAIGRWIARTLDLPMRWDLGVIAGPEVVEPKVVNMLTWLENNR